ncbi:FkbM family methyltransferase [Methylobacillus arboreus]|uniref:FkbM family methyltransferase n=1 Tax=Methylobacillus arboreus TaxID=755170 RepID=UPI001E5AB17B|nr:FkbM family methyltransferase [Methylobacillus arboreus]MCB5190865.1 FkbM family methyltransferase [Methylobacillus arboreus]
MHHKDTFLAAVQALAQDPLHTVPEAARAIIAKSGKAAKIVILGTRGLGSYLLDLPAPERYCDVVAVVDDSRSKSESTYRNLPLVTTAQFIAMSKQHSNLLAINTCSKQAPQQFFNQVCRDNDIACINFEQAIRALGLNGKLDYRVEDWGPDIVRNAARYQTLEKRLGDDTSVATLYALLSHYLSCKLSYVRDVQLPYSALYFRSGLLHFGKQEKMVDCGASTGESLRGLLNVTNGEFARSWMIEPDRNNVRVLQSLINHYQGTALADRISLHPCGAGETAMHVHFKHEGGHGGAVIANGMAGNTDMVEVQPIDDIVDDVPTFIKMDIEGSELSALKGARRTISAHKPKLAISAYHRSMDLLDLTDYVLSLNPDYRVSLRHHTPLRWDTCLYFY